MTTIKSFSQLRKSTSNFESLQKKLKETAEGKKDYKDSRFWSVVLDKSKSGQADIRFLDVSEGDEIPFVKLYSHGFKGPGGWFIEECPTTIGLPCPCCEHNNSLWNSGIDSDKKIVQGDGKNPGRKRKLNYISNVYVVNDPANPENNGKVFLFKYGKKIFDKISEAASPTFEGEKSVNVFNMWEGANFKLRIVSKDGYPNYDKSHFDTAKPLLESDEEMETIWKSQYKLSEFVETGKFKTYNDIASRFAKVTGVKGSGGSSSARVAEVDESFFDDVQNSKFTGKHVTNETITENDVPESVNMDEIDSELADFKALLGDDE